MNKWLTSVAILLGLGVSMSEAQPPTQPNTRPSVRPGTSPSYNPYTGGGAYGPFLGNPNVLRPGPGTTAPGLTPPGGLAPESTGDQASGAFDNVGVDLQANNITGHRTAFNSYSRYFNNQGGSFGANSQTGSLSRTNPNSGTNQRRFITVGSTPPRGRSNTSQP